jgi:hypothetical protein
VDEPASEFDAPWKEVLDWYFQAFLGFFFPAAHDEIDWTREPDYADKELQKIAPEAETGRGTVDKLAKVWRRDGIETWVFVHVEVQSQHDTSFGRRMYTYNHRLEDRYGRMPVTLAVLGDDSPAWRPTGYAASLWGCEVGFTFPVAKLLDYKDREATLETDPNPFSALVLAHLKTLQTRGEVSSRQDWKLRLVKGLYDRGWEQEMVLKLFRAIDWMMTLPAAPQAAFVADMAQFEARRTMPFISPTEQIWYSRGEAKGIAQGMTQGITHGIEVGLDVRFGTAGLDLLPRVQEIKDPALLEAFLRAIKTAPTLDALRALLPTDA